MLNIWTTGWIDKHMQGPRRMTCDHFDLLTHPAASWGPTFNLSHISGGLWSNTYKTNHVPISLRIDSSTSNHAWVKNVTGWMYSIVCSLCVRAGNSTVCGSRVMSIAPSRSWFSRGWVDGSSYSNSVNSSSLTALTLREGNWKPCPAYSLAWMTCQSTPPFTNHTAWMRWGAGLCVIFIISEDI